MNITAAHDNKSTCIFVEKVDDHVNLCVTDGYDAGCITLAPAEVKALIAALVELL